MNVITLLDIRCSKIEIFISDSLHLPRRRMQEDGTEVAIPSLQPVRSALLSSLIFNFPYFILNYLTSLPSDRHVEKNVLVLDCVVFCVVYKISSDSVISMIFSIL